MPHFEEALALDDLPAGSSTTVTLGGREIAVFNVDGEIFAMDDACPHAGASLGWGKFEGRTVTCRAHGLRLNVATGKLVNNPAVGVPTYPTRVEGGKILIALG